MNINLKPDPDTRIQLHWATQLLSAAADATLEAAEDDSHSNLEWLADSHHLVGRSGVSLDVTRFCLNHQQTSFALLGETLASARQWLSQALGQELSFRDYDMPKHQIPEGGRFNPDRASLESIAKWFSFAQNHLAKYGGLRVWPHHFDLGFWNPGSEGKSIGGGFSQGDNHFDQPYFYINPYGVEQPGELPPLPAGHWSKHWFGAVLLADEIDSDRPSDTTSSFVEAAMNVCRSLTQ